MTLMWLLLTRCALVRRSPGMTVLPILIVTCWPLRFLTLMRVVMSIVLLNLCGVLPSMTSTTFCSSWFY